MPAKHFDEGKPRVDLIPYDAMMVVGEVFSVGAEKYGEHNWEKGMPWGKLLGSALRHLFKWSWGQDRDDETGLSHLAHAASCVLMLLAYRCRNMVEFDNRFVHGADTQTPLPFPVKITSAFTDDSEGGTPD